MWHGKGICTNWISPFHTKVEETCFLLHLITPPHILSFLKVFLFCSAYLLCINIMPRIKPRFMSPQVMKPHSFITADEALQVIKHQISGFAPQCSSGIQENRTGGERRRKKWVGQRISIHPIIAGFISVILQGVSLGNIYHSTYSPMCSSNKT